MKSRWLRWLFLLLVIMGYVGFVATVSMADEPDVIVEVGAYNNTEQASALGRYRPTEVRGRELYSNPATPPAYSMATIKNVVNTVATSLQDAQVSGGWGINLESLGQSPLPNLYGITGMGLLAAYQMTVGMDELGDIIHGQDSESFLLSAIATGQALLSQQNLLSTDIVFLYGLSKVVADGDLYEKGLMAIQAYTAANNNVDDVYDLYNTEQADEYPEIAQIKHWNLALWVEAAKLYANAEATADPTTSAHTATAQALNTWADALMGKIIADQNGISGAFTHNTLRHVRTASQAKVVEVLKRFYNTTRQTEITKGLACLKGLQSDAAGGTSSSGAFRAGGTIGTAGDLTPWTSISLQDQCYGIQAMAYNAQTTWSNYDRKKGTYWAAGYLLDSMMNNDGLFVDDFSLTEVRADRNSEALQALYYSCREGDVDKSGKIIAYDALQTLKASVGLVMLDGPAIVAAKRKTAHNESIHSQDALTILSDSVGKCLEPIRGFLGL